MDADDRSPEGGAPRVTAPPSTEPAGPPSAALARETLDDATIADTTIADATVADATVDDAKTIDRATIDDSALLERTTLDEPPPRPSRLEQPTLTNEARPLTKTDPAPQLVDDQPPILDPLASERAPSKKPKKRRSILGWFVRVFVVLLALAGIGAAIVYVYWDQILRAVVIAQAKQHGIDLDFATVKLTKTELTLGKAHVRMQDLSSVDVRADQIVVALDDRFRPTGAKLAKLTVALADAPDVTIKAVRATTAISDFTPKDIHVESVEVEAPTLAALVGLAKVATTEPLASIGPDIAGVKLHVAKMSAGWPIELAVAASSVKTTAGTTTLTAVETTLPIVDLPVSLREVSIAREQNGFSLHIPEAEEIGLTLDPSAGAIHATLAKVPADLLAKKFGWSRPPGFALTASADLNLPAKEGDAPTGTFTATLDHYIPPHPIELNGIVFGDATKGSGAFVLRGGHLDLSDLKVDAGALHLSGKGSAEVADGGRVDLDLGGNIACNELAVSAVAAHLGLAVAAIGGELAGPHITGSVEVKLGVVLRGKDASHPEIHPAAFLHCGVRLL